MNEYFAIALLVLSCSTYGCANFSKYAPKMDEVSYDTEMAAGPPIIELKQDASDSNNMIGAAMNVAAASQGIQAANMLKGMFDRNIDTGTIETTLRDGMTSALAGGGPFEITEEGEDGRILLKVLAYGVERTGTTPTFTGTYLVRVRYAPESKTVFRRRFNCERGGFFEATDASVFEAASFKKAVDNMSDEQFLNRYRNHVEQCTAEIARRLRAKAN